MQALRVLASRNNALRISARKTIATLLWATALAPFGFYLAHLASPYATVVLALRLSSYGQETLLALLAVAVLALFLYPPFWPGLRLRLAGIRRKLGTDAGPLYEGLGRLRHLETHADRLLVGRTALQLGRLPLALENLLRAQQMDPTHTGSAYSLAQALLQVGNLKDAATLLYQVVQKDEQQAYGDAQMLLGEVLLRLGEDELCSQVLERHETLFPGSRKVHLLRARALRHLGKKDEAREQLRLAAQPKAKNERLSHEEALARAKARVMRLRGGELR